jgi:hypothetical protein
MFQIQAPIVIVPTAESKLAVGIHLQAAGLAAYREIALAAVKCGFQDNAFAKRSPHVLQASYQSIDAAWNPN